MTNNFQKLYYVMKIPISENRNWNQLTALSQDSTYPDPKFPFSPRIQNSHKPDARSLGKTEEDLLYKKSDTSKNLRLPGFQTVCSPSDPLPSLPRCSDTSLIAFAFQLLSSSLHLHLPP